MLSLKTLDTYYLEARRDLLEVAAMLDRYDEAVKDGAKQWTNPKDSLLQAMNLLSQPDHPQANRAEQLLVLFPKIA